MQNYSFKIVNVPSNPGIESWGSGDWKFPAGTAMELQKWKYWKFSVHSIVLGNIMERFCIYEVGSVYEAGSVVWPVALLDSFPSSSETSPWTDAARHILTCVFYSSLNCVTNFQYRNLTWPLEKYLILQATVIGTEPWTFMQKPWRGGNIFTPGQLPGLM